MKIFKIEFLKLYQLYEVKVNKKHVDTIELDKVLTWLTGISIAELKLHLSTNITVEDFFNNLDNFNPMANNIKGKICGVTIEDILDPLMQKIRYLDKLVDLLAKGKTSSDIIMKYQS